MKASDRFLVDLGVRVIGFLLILAGVAGLAAYYLAKVRGMTRNEPVNLGAAAAAAVVVFGLIGTVLWQGHQLEAAALGARDAAFEIDRRDAVADSLKRIAAAADSGRAVWERRAVQAEIERDRVDALLRTERHATARLRGQIAGLEAEVGAGVSIDSARPEVRLVSSVIREHPFTVTIRGEVGPDSARLRVAVEVDPIELLVDFRCGEPAPPTGIRPAHVTVEGPEWLRISDVVARAREEDCNPPPPPPPSFLERAAMAAPWAALAAAVGVIVGATR